VRREDIDKRTEQVIGAAIEVHRELGPGLLESAYEECLAHEFLLREIPFERQKPLPLTYKNAKMNADFRLDFVVAGTILVELKAVELLQPLHDAQVLTYLKLSGLRVGLLINFNVKMLRDGIRRLVLNLDEKSSPRSPRSLR
jgi:GxxExxY protein